MTNDAQPQPTTPKNVLPELIIPAMAFIFTAYYLTTITEVPWIAQASAITVSSLLLLSLAAFAIRTVFRIKRGQERVSWDFPRADPVVTARRIALLAMAIGYVLAIEHAGFTLTTAVFIFFAIILLSSLAKWRSALAVSLTCSVLGYVVFIHFFKTRFPKGPIEQFMKGLL